MPPQTTRPGCAASSSARPRSGAATSPSTGCTSSSTTRPSAPCCARTRSGRSTSGSSGSSTACEPPRGRASPRLAGPRLVISLGSVRVSGHSRPDAKVTPCPDVPLAPAAVAAAAARRPRRLRRRLRRRTPPERGLGLRDIEGDVGQRPEGRPGTARSTVDKAARPRRWSPGDGEEVEDGDQVAHAPLDRQRLHPGEGARAPTRTKKPELITGRRPDLSPVFRDGARRPDHRLPRRGRRARRGGLRRERQPDARRSATRTRSSSSSTWSASVLDGPRATEKDAPQLDARDRREGRRAHQPRLHRHARARRAELQIASRSSRATAPRSRRARRRGQLPRPGLRRQEAVRRELQPRRAGPFHDRRRRGRQGLGQGAGRRARSAAG